MDSPRLARKASSIPAALTPMLKSLGLEEEDPEDVFEILSKEGAGAFGRVFCASYRRDPTKLAALKVIPIALEAGQRGEDVENVRREIQFLRECDHPNVVAFFGAYYKDSALWVAMEYCGGGSVGDVSRHRRLSEDEIAVIMRGALYGLAYLHARKKIHRDIKGGNILLTSDGAVKIADFGVSAQLKDTLSRRGTFVGTPYWMSPEMIQDSDYDYKSDIWSLGITMIELADQKPPLFDEHPMRVLIQIPRNPAPSVKQPHLWTPLFTQFLQYCLQKDPHARPSALECLEHPFIKRSESIAVVFARPPPLAVEGGEGMELPSATGGHQSVSVDGESEALADDVTLKASAVRPPKPPVDAPPPLPLPIIISPPPLAEQLQDDSISSSGESITEEMPALTSSQSLTDGDEFFTADTPPVKEEATATAPVDGMELSLDDSFELPPMAVISKIHAAASTLSMRLPPSSNQVQNQTLAPASAVSPINRPGSFRPPRFPSSTDSPPLLQATPSPNPKQQRVSVPFTEQLKPVVPPPSTEWTNPLADLARSSHDRVNSLLSSISSSRLTPPSLSYSTSAAPPFPPLSLSTSFVDVSASGSPPPGPPPPLPSTDISASNNHFIGSPFRVSHQLCVKFNTVDAQFHGVPQEWHAVHRQFGVALAQLRRRTNSDEHSVPALVLMLHRELLQRDGLQCKYIYRVSPDQNDVLRAKQAIDHGTFDQSSVRDPHVFASLIKLWLRELPRALLASLSREELADAVHWLVDSSSSTPQDKTPPLVLAKSFDNIHSYVTGTVLAKLPADERTVLLWLVDHLLEVVDKSSRNGMQDHSLAVVFAPTVYRWASATPQDATAVSAQVATLLRVLLAWRRRCHDGGVATTGIATTESSRRQSVRGRVLPPSDPGSLSHRRSMVATSSKESTVSGLLRRSSVPSMSASSFTAMAEPPTNAPPPAMERTRQRMPLEDLLRECVDGLQNELPQSLAVDDRAPIVRSLHVKFQRQVLSLIEQNARRGTERQWATKTLGHPGVDHLELLPVGLRGLRRWLHAALSLDEFVKLLNAERHARDQVEKRWPGSEGTIPVSLVSVADSFRIQHRMALAALDEPLPDPVDSSIVDAQSGPSLDPAMVDGAAAMVKLLHKSQASIPLAEDLARQAQQEPVLGTLLTAMSGQKMGRYHLADEHKRIIASVRELVANDL